MFRIQVHFQYLVSWVPLSVWIQRQSAHKKGIQETILNTTFILDLNSRECGSEDSVKIMIGTKRASDDGVDLNSITMIIIGCFYCIAICKGFWVGMDGYLNAIMWKFDALIISGWNDLHDVNP